MNAPVDAKQFKVAKSGAASASNASDTTFSTDLVEVLLGLSEGPIKGLKDGDKSFHVGETPLRDAGGETNFDKFKLTFRGGGDAGEDITSQLGGFGTSTSVAVNLASGVSVVRSGTVANIDYLDVRLVISQLYVEDDEKPKKGTLKLKVEYKANSSGTWLNIPGTVVPPDYFDGGDFEQYEAFTNGNENVLPSPDDRVIYWQSATPPNPGAGDIKPTWFKTTEDNKPYVWNGSSWVAATAAVKTTGAAISYWSWTEIGFPRKAFVVGSSGALNNPTSPIIGDFWLTTKFGSNQTLFYNGSIWVQAGQTIQPIVQNDVVNGVVTITERITSQCVRELRIPVPRINEGYSLRITKQSPLDSDTEKHADVAWESFQEVVAKTFNFPNTATIQMLARASDQFSSLPELWGIYHGRIVKVPSNYNAETRVYTGIWDGLWILSYTNNPAYIVKDLVENTRYGMNAYYPIVLDKFDVYAAGQWCDQQVDNGQAGTRPRFTFNGLLTEPRSGREAVDYIAGTFGGRFFDDGNGFGSIKIDIDEPAVKLFTNENVVDSVFSYSWTDPSTRFNDITVAYTNPDLNWEEDRRRVFDQDHIDYYGRIPLNFTAVGCTNESEAIARAKYKLITSTTETMVVTFKTNRQGLYLAPYRIILISDQTMSTGFSGRVKEVTGPATFTLRDAFTKEIGITYKVKFDTVNDAGEFEIIERTLEGSSNGALTTLTTTTDLPALSDNTVFTIEAVATIGLPKAFRVQTIVPEEDDPDNVVITAIEVNREKWTVIDGDAPGPIDVGDPNIDLDLILPVPDVRVTPGTMQIGAVSTPVLQISWDPSPSIGAIKYRLYQRFNDGPLTLMTETTELNYSYVGFPPGDFLFGVTAVSVQGVESKPLFIIHHTSGETRAPVPVNTIVMLDEPYATVYESRSPRFAWDMVEDTFHHDYVVRILNGVTVVREVSTLVQEFQYQYSDNVADNGGTPIRQFTIQVNARDQYGAESNPITLTVNNTAPAAPTGIQITVNNSWIIGQCAVPALRDFSGIQVHIDGSAGFTPSGGTLVYDGPTTNFIVQKPIGTHYVKIAYYDLFSKTGLNYSASTQAIVFNAGDADFTPPAAPTGLAASVGFQSVGLSWTNPADADFDHVEIYKNTTNNSGTAVLAGDMIGTSVVMDGLAAGTQVYFWLKAVDKSGNKSSFSGVASAIPRALVNTDIAAGAVDNAAIAAAAIDSTKVSPGAITGPLIANLAITAAHVAASAIGTTQIAADAVTAAQLAAGSVGSSEIAAGAVIAGKIAAGTIVANDIAAGTITGNKIAATTITASNIAAATITANEIAAATITGNKIAADTITGGHISANSINAKQLAIGNFDNIIQNGSFAANNFDGWTDLEAALWTIVARGGSSPQSIAPTPYMLSIGVDATNRDMYWSSPYPCKPGDQFYISVDAAATTTAANLIKFYLTTIGADGTTNATAHLVNVTVNTTGWLTYTLTVTIGAGVSAMRFRMARDANAGTGTVYMTNISVMRVSEGTLIKNGAITTAKISAGAITANEIAAGTITANELAAGAITAGKIAAGAIVANDIAAATITGNKIAAGTITAGNIQAASITASLLNVSVLSAITANVGTLSAGIIQNGVGGLLIDIDNNLMRSGNYAEDGSGNPYAGIEIDGTTGTMKAVDMIAAGITITKRPLITTHPGFRNGVPDGDPVFYWLSGNDIEWNPTNNWAQMGMFGHRTPEGMEHQFYTYDNGGNSLSIYGSTFIPPGALLPPQIVADFGSKVCIWYADGTIEASTLNGNGVAASTSIARGRWIYDVETDPLNTRNATKMIAGLGVSRKVQPLRVPYGITAIQFKVWGAGGGNDNNGTGFGGPGGYVAGTVSVGPSGLVKHGEMLYLIVGQGGLSKDGRLTVGFGGPGQSQNERAGGGGLSGVFVNTISIATALLIAGGGGGSQGPQAGGPGGSASAGSNGISGADYEIMSGLGWSYSGSNSRAGGGGGRVGGGYLTASGGNAGGRGGTNYIDPGVTSTTNSSAAQSGNGNATTATPPNSGDADLATNQYCLGTATRTARGKTSTIVTETGGNGLIVVTFV